MSRSGTVKARLAALATTLVLAGCASVTDNQPLGPNARATIDRPAPAAPTPTSTADAEHQRLIASYGGAYRNAATETYLEDIIQRIAAQSDRPDIQYRLTILNSPTINAFALPSGRMYVTRGLLALANDDSEIAAVLAHEMAHVSEKHALARADIERRGELVSKVMTNVLNNPAGGKASEAKAAVRLASFSRTQEIDADRIGVRTIANAGFDPYGAARFLTSMNRQTAFRSTAQPPGTSPRLRAYDFLSTHPPTTERIELASAEAQRFVNAGRSTKPDRVGYLRAIDGIVYGDDPSQGFVRGTTFVHPRLGFTFDTPPQFTLDNTPQAILGLDGSGRALRLDTVRLKSGQSLDTYLSSGWIEGVDNASVKTLTINGNPAVTGVAKSSEWSFRLYAIQLGDDVYRLIYAARALTPATDAAFQRSAMSFRPLTSTEVSNVHPLRVEIATARSGDTVETLSSRMALPDAKAARFLLLNGFDSSTTLSPGERVKIIIR